MGNGKPRTGRSARLAYGEGTIDQLSNGTWRGRVMVGGRRVPVYGTTRVEVKQAMADERDRADNPEPGDGAPTLGEWVDEWLADYTPDDVTDNTVENYRYGLVAFEPLYDTPLSELTTADLEARLRDLANRGRGLARRTLKIYLGHLALCIDGYNTRERLVYNPARDARLPKSAKASKQRRTFTNEQASAMLDAAVGDPLECAVVVGLYLGLRPGEVCGLPWSAVDLDAGTLDVVQFRRVTRSRDADGEATPAETAMADPKARSDRRMGLPAPVVVALRARHRQQSADELVATNWSNPEGLVVTTRYGGPIDPANLRRTIRRLAKVAGVDWTPPPVPYELRHTAASLLLESTDENGVPLPLEEVADLLGHSVQVLIDNYRHRSKRVVTKHVAVAESLYAVAK